MDKRFHTRNLFLFSLFFAVGLAVIFVYRFLPTSFVMREGEDAAMTVWAQNAVSYESEVAHEQQVEKLKENFPVSIQTNWSIAPRQRELLVAFLTALEGIRENEAYNELEKQNLLQQQLALMPFTLEDAPDSVDDQVIALSIMRFSRYQWEVVKSEAIRVLDNLHKEGVMQGDLEKKKATLVQEVQGTLLPEQREVVVRLVNPFVRENVFEDEEKTAQRLEDALKDVKVPTRVINKGDVVVRKGEALTTAHLEALRELGFDVPTLDTMRVAKLAVLALLVSAMSFVFLAFFTPKISYNLKALFVVALLVLVGALLIRNLLPERPHFFYVVPIGLAPLLLATFVDRPLGFWALCVFAITTATIPTDIHMFLMFIILASVVAMVFKISTRYLYDYARLGFLMAGVTFVQALFFHWMASSEFSFDILVKFVGVSMGHGFFLAVGAIFGLMYLGRVFDFVTYFQLVELANLNHPLLLKLSAQAPGTYHHSLTIAELAQAAAEKIGAHTLLVKAYALYHDVGKLYAPEIFIENQSAERSDVLQKLSPAKAAQKIIAHVPEGIKLMKKYRIPEPLWRAVLSHHGTTRVEYFYQKALAAAAKTEEVKPEKFTYPGILPKNREETILMLADGIEAVTRSATSTSPDELRSLLDGFVQRRIDEGQLRESKLTIGELELVKESFYHSLMGIYHPRLDYRKASAHGKRTGKSSQRSGKVS